MTPVRLADGFLFRLLEALGGEGVELSVSTTSSAAGVLVPAVDADLRLRLACAWGTGRMPADGDRIRFVRCDIDRDAWCGITWYGDGVGEGRGVPPAVASLPAWGYSRREAGSGRETTCYFVASGDPKEALVRRLDASAKWLGFSSRASHRLVGIAARLCEAGWQQLVGIVECAPARIKLDVVPFGLRALEPVIASECDDLACDVLAAFTRLGARLGYAACSVDSSGRCSWRLYTRPIRASRIADLLEPLWQ